MTESSNRHTTTLTILQLQNSYDRKDIPQTEQKIDHGISYRKKKQQTNKQLNNKQKNISWAVFRTVNFVKMLMRQNRVYWP